MIIARVSHVVYLTTCVSNASHISYVRYDTGWASPEQTDGARHLPSNEQDAAVRILGRDGSEIIGAPLFICGICPAICLPRRLLRG